MKITLHDLTFRYGAHTILNAISLEVPQGSITAITGPSGEGKSSLLSVINHLWQPEEGTRVTGSALAQFKEGPVDLLSPQLNRPLLRQKATMVFQNPTPLPFSIFKNVSLPLTFAGIRDKVVIHQNVERALTRAGLWSEVSHRLKSPAATLSGGQQQRLAMARALVTNPEILLLDEPTSSLDAESRDRIEAQLLELKKSCTLLLVSHSEDQVNRLADRVYCLIHGNLERKR